MFDNKYSNILTMFLIVLIVAILGIIGYFAYDLMNRKSINSNAQSVLDELQKSTTVKRDTSNLSKNNTTDDNTTDGDIDSLMNQLNTTSNQTTVNNEPEKVYMEDYQVMGSIKIPKTGIEYPVLETAGKRELEMAVGIAYGPGLNEIGNTVIYGHNYRNGLFFSNNKKLVNGDTVLITDASGLTLTYVIYNIYQTTGNDASYMQRDTEGRREISLQTCTDDSSARIIVWAKEQGS